jgi:methionine-rich copper-binding protein CopC
VEWNVRYFRESLIGLAATLTAGAASAHAYLQRAEPPSSSTVPTAPPQMTLNFTQGVESPFSQVVVTNAQD